LDSFLFLQGLLDDQDLIFGFKIKGLLSTGKRFDEDLCRTIAREGARNERYWEVVPDMCVVVFGFDQYVLEGKSEEAAENFA